MRVLHRFTMGKSAAESHLNEDAIACARTRGIFAVSDGASESFASQLWARALVRRFVRRPIIDKSAVASAVRQFNSAFDRGAMSWSAQAAFDRGSFATLLGVQIEGQNATVLGIGDSLAVLTEGGEVRETFPYTTPEQFHANPLLLSTILERNSAILDQRPSVRWSFKDMQSPRILCMTDALGAWLLSDRVTRAPILLALTSISEFEALVEEERARAAMRRDDTSLLVLG